MCAKASSLESDLQAAQFELGLMRFGVQSYHQLHQRLQPHEFGCQASVQQMYSMSVRHLHEVDPRSLESRRGTGPIDH